MSGSLYAQQQVTLDWKMHDVGSVRQFISNIGCLWPTGYLLGDFTGRIYCEFPPNSEEEHIGEGGIWVGALAGGDTLVSVASSWHSSAEFFPSSALWDTIWVIQRGDTVDIPYWPGYVAVSDQDFVCRYSDYNLTNIALHTPLYLDVIQTSYAWSSPPLDEMIVYNFYVTSTQIDLKDTYISYWLDGNVGYRGQGWDFALDDYSVYYEDRHLAVSIDQPGGVDGTAYGPIGIKIYPPDDVPEVSPRWAFNWVENPDFGPPSRDPQRYTDMASGIIQQNQPFAVGSQFYISFGPFDLQLGDTLHFMVGQILGEGVDGMLENADRLDWLIAQDFKVPSPPPPPPLRVVTDNRKVTLSWEPQAGDVNPEEYQDPYRADTATVTQPFEGYRVYKSTQSATGPWTLLAEYDLPNNDYGQNTGLEREYIDIGLLNNLEYFYTVTAFSKPDIVIDFPSLESSTSASVETVVPGTAPPATVGQVTAVPNPYRGDIDYNAFNPKWERNPPGRPWMEQDRRIQFISLPAACKITIYSLAGDQIQALVHNDPGKGYEDWDLTSSVGQSVSSGIYLFTVQDTNTGEVQVGKFVIIK
ncbi:MAG: hypothetical protein KAU50_02560 [Candidatus Marinimicrobia bacterium]|nr:hypothetical protein [Candidatus Neomarinimicrobiota bacterium]